MKQLCEVIPKQSSSEICQTYIVLHGPILRFSISAMSSKERSVGMDTVEAGLFKSVIVSRTGILPAPEAVLVGQAFQPACPEMAGWKACPTTEGQFSRFFYHFPEFLEKIS
jgi:hypothetical protein